MENVNSEENWIKLIEKFIKKSVLVILNKRIKPSIKSRNQNLNSDFLTNEVESIDLDIEEIFSDEYSGIYSNESNIYYSLSIFLKKKNQNMLIEKWNFEYADDKTDNCKNFDRFTEMNKKLNTLMRSIYSLSRFLPVNSLKGYDSLDFTLDYKLSTNLYNQDKFAYSPQKYKFKSYYNFSIEIEYLVKNDIINIINNNKKSEKNFNPRRPRFYSENVECKKIEIINFDKTTIEDNYFINKLNSKSKYDGYKYSNNLETIESFDNAEEYDSKIDEKTIGSNFYYSENYTIIYDDESDSLEIENLKDKDDKNFDLVYIQKESSNKSQRRIDGKNNYANEINLVKENRTNNGHLNINSNNIHSYRIKNKKKDFHEKYDLKMNLIKNVNISTNTENITKYNKINLKNYYQNLNRKKHCLVKINENSESETESIKKKSKNIIHDFTSDFTIENIDNNSVSNKGSSDIFENANEAKSDNNKQNNKTAEKSNKKEIINNKNQENYKNKDNNFENQTLYFIGKTKENNFSNSSDNQCLIKLKNLNTNDTTSLKSSENLLSKTNSFELNYNSDDELEHSVVLSEDEKELLKGNNEGISASLKNKKENFINLNNPSEGEEKVPENNKKNSESNKINDKLINNKSSKESLIFEKENILIKSSVILNNLIQKFKTIKEKIDKNSVNNYNFFSLTNTKRNESEKETDNFVILDSEEEEDNSFCYEINFDNFKKFVSEIKTKLKESDDIMQK